MKSLSAFELSLAGKLAELLHAYCDDDGIKKQPSSTNKRFCKEKNPEEALQEIKTMCKTVAEAPGVCCQVILNEYFTRTATKVSLKQRTKALFVANELFSRSAAFRSTLCSNGGLSTLIASMSNSGDEAPQMFVDWNVKFGGKYPQLAMAVESNKRLMGYKREMELAQQMQATVDSHQLEEIKRGFRIWNGAQLTGLGESVAQVLTAAEQQIKELDICAQLFLTFPDEEEEEALEWEHDEESDLALATAAMPQDYTLAVSFTTSVDAGKLSDVQSTMREGVLTITRTLLPPIRLWANALERAVIDAADDSTVSLLRQVKTLIRELNEVVDQCSRCIGKNSM